MMTNMTGKVRNVGLGVLLVAVAPLAIGGPQTPPSGPMTVVNTDANPVPVRAPSPLPVSGNVTITGTANVSVTNTPAVSQSGTWNVGITGTPSFSLVTPTTPIPVTVGAPDRTVVQFTTPFIRFPANTIASSGTVYHNASGKVLVIEQVSMFVTSDAGTIGGAALQLTTTANGMSASHFPLQVEELPGNGRAGAKSARVRIYVDPGTDIDWDLQRGDNAGASTVQISFSGYLTSSP